MEHLLPKGQRPNHSFFKLETIAQAVERGNREASEAENQLQTIYTGRSVRSLPPAANMQRTVDMGFKYTYSSNHWATIDTQKEWVLEVFKPYIATAAEQPPRAFRSSEEEEEEAASDSSEAASSSDDEPLAEAALRT